jgi:HK97 family phage major capsid protein
MTLEEILAKIEDAKTRYAAVVDKVATENRAMEKTEVDGLAAIKAEITALEAQRKDAQNVADANAAVQARNAAAARASAQGSAPKSSNEFYRSITKGSSNVGTKEVVTDVVRVYETQSPLFAAHQNKQLRLTGEKYTYPKITAGSGGYAKTEGNAGSADTGTTVVMVDATFVTYSSQTITVSQEMIDDAGFDISGEITAVGLSKSTTAFDAAAATALLAYDNTPTETAATSWSLADLIAAYYEIPTRNRNGVKFIMAAATVPAILNLLTTDNAPKAAAIGLSAENIIVDDNITANLVVLCNPTLALAIGMKEQVRVFVDEVSAGRTYEVQPRLAVGLRDGTAVSGRILKAA